MLNRICMLAVMELALVLLVPALRADAGVYTAGWLTEPLAHSSDWFDANNWDHGAPGANDNASILGPASPYPQISAGTAVAATVHVGDNGLVVLNGGAMETTMTCLDEFGGFDQGGGTHTTTTLWIDAAAPALYTMRNGQLTIRDGGCVELDQRGEFLQTNGTLSAGGASLLVSQNARFRMDGGQATVGDVYVQHGQAAELGVYGGVFTARSIQVGPPDTLGGQTHQNVFRIGSADAALTVTDALTLDVGSQFSAVAGAVVCFGKPSGATQAFRIMNTNADDLSGLGQTTFCFEGGSVVCTLEAAGAGDGRNDGFRFGGIAVGGLGAVGHVKLVDAVNNGLRVGGEESMFADSLMIGAGSTLDMAGLPIFVTGDVRTSLQQMLDDGRLIDTVRVGHHFVPKFDVVDNVTFIEAPEPGTLAFLVVGAALWLRRRK